MAQAMRAILLANATAATLTGLRSMIRASHSRFVPCCRAYRMTAMAPVTRSHRKYRLPCFEILPRRSLPPVECCLGTSPIQAAKLRPDENSFQSPTSATRAVATSGPTPGISSSRRLSSHDRCQARGIMAQTPQAPTRASFAPGRGSGAGLPEAAEQRRPALRPSEAR